VALSNVVIGYNQVALGTEVAAGRETIRLGLASYRETQGELLRPFILSRLAEAEVALGEIDAAQATMREAIEVAEALEAHGFVPELLLRQAQLLTVIGQQDQLRGLLQRAIDTALLQGAIAIASAASEELKGSSPGVRHQGVLTVAPKLPFSLGVPHARRQQ
jgi:hypothetical protein